MSSNYKYNYQNILKPYYILKNCQKKDKNNRNRFRKNGFYFWYKIHLNTTKHIILKTHAIITRAVTTNTIIKINPSSISPLMDVLVQSYNGCSWRRTTHYIKVCVTIPVIYLWCCKKFFTCTKISCSIIK